MFKSVFQVLDLDVIEQLSKGQTWRTLSDDDWTVSFTCLPIHERLL